jgi:hypothetical protein
VQFTRNGVAESASPRRDAGVTAGAWYIMVAMTRTAVFWTVALLALGPLARAASGDSTTLAAATPEGDAARVAAGAAALERIKTPSPITDRFAFRAIFFSGSVRTDAQINDTRNGLAGTPYSAERDFGLPDSARQARAEFMFRLRQRGRVRLSTLDLARKASRVMTQRIAFSNQTYQVNERVNSTFDVREFDFTYTYSVLRGDRFELAPGLGFHFIQAEVTAVAPARAARATFNSAGAFPTVALDGTWRLTRRFALTARYQFQDIHVGDIASKVDDLHADLQFRWHKNLAVGLGYQSNGIQLDMPTHDPGGALQFKFSGPELFLRASF